MLISFDRSTRKELENISEILSKVPKQFGMNSKETQRKVQSVNRLKENKVGISEFLNYVFIWVFLHICSFIRILPNSIMSF